MIALAGKRREAGMGLWGVFSNENDFELKSNEGTSGVL